MAERGATWAEQAYGVVPHGAWNVLVWALSIMAGLGIVTGALFLMPAVTAFVGSFFVDEIADAVERSDYPAEPPGRDLPVVRAMIEGVKTALLAILVYVVALPFLLFGIGVLVLVGMWFERFMLIVSSLYQDFLPSSWGMFYPTLWDLAFLFGSIGLFFTLFLLFVRWLPLVSMFELRKLVHRHGGAPA
jgi:uncharacterized protein involved in cysteine biosynthesis